MNSTLTDVQIKNIFKNGMDEDGNGRIDRDELMIVLSFNISDTDDNGYIDLPEFEKMTSSILGEKVSDINDLKVHLLYGCNYCGKKPIKGKAI